MKRLFVLLLAALMLLSLAACGEEAYYGQFDGKTAETYKDVDAIGGATMTTDGYMKAIERCFEAVKILEGGAK